MYSGVPTSHAKRRHQRAVGRVHRGGLGQPEIDDLRYRLVVAHANQNVRRLQIPVNDPLLMGVVHSVADLNEQFEPLPGRESVAIAIRRDRFAAHALHGEVRTALGRGTSIEHLRDRRMRHDCQRLTLGLEARDHLARVHASLDHFERHLAFDRVRLFGEPDLAIPPVPMRWTRRYGPTASK
jgi:hypothetical protein